MASAGIAFYRDINIDDESGTIRNFLPPTRQREASETLIEVTSSGANSNHISTPPRPPIASENGGIFSRHAEAAFLAPTHTTTVIAKSQSLPIPQGSELSTINVTDTRGRLSDNFFKHPPSQCTKCGQNLPDHAGEHPLNNPISNFGNTTGGSMTINQLTAGSMFEIKAKSNTHNKARKTVEVESQPVMGLPNLPIGLGGRLAREGIYNLVPPPDLTSQDSASQASGAGAEEFRARVFSLPSTDDMWDNEGMPDKNEGVDESEDLIEIDPTTDHPETVTNDQGLHETPL